MVLCHHYGGAEMSDARMVTHLRPRRERLGLSQAALAERVGVSRQAILAIEAGRQVPATSLALQLARALACRVDDLFELEPAGLTATLAPADAGTRSAALPESARVALGQVEGRWVAHRLPLDARLATDGLVRALGTGDASIEPLGDLEDLRRNVLVAGCAPLLGAVAQRVGARSVDARITWLPASSKRALALLADGLVHVAGVHLHAEWAGEDNLAAVRKAFPGQRMVVVNLTRWRQGLVLPAGNPLGLGALVDLLRPGLRFAGRDQGAGAGELIARLVARTGGGRPAPEGPLAAGHVEVAQLVRCGAADAGVAIEGVALAAGLDFLPLSEERFDLVIPAAVATSRPVMRLLEALDDPGFRASVSHLPGYDGSLSGHVTTLEAA